MPVTLFYLFKKENSFFVRHDNVGQLISIDIFYYNAVANAGIIINKSISNFKDSLSLHWPPSVPSTDHFAEEDGENYPFYPGKSFFDGIF